MKSLQTKSCLKLVEKYSLSEVLDEFDLDNNFKLLCSNDEDFWMKFLAEKFNRFIVLQRMDIKQYQWLEFARRLNQGIQFELDSEVSRGEYGLSPHVKSVDIESKEIL